MANEYLQKYRAYLRVRLGREATNQELTANIVRDVATGDRAQSLARMIHAEDDGGEITLDQAAQSWSDKRVVDGVKRVLEIAGKRSR